LIFSGRRSLTVAVLFALPLVGEPRLLLNSSDFARIHTTAASHAGAGNVVEQLIHEADDWPARHLREFGLSEWALPKEGAGWSHDYVCPVHGVRLRQEGGKNICPVHLNLDSSNHREHGLDIFNSGSNKSP
jgi:oligo-alginate lyase